MLAKRYIFFTLLFFTGFGCYAQSPFQIDLKVTNRYATVNAIEIDDMLLTFDLKGNIHFDSDNKTETDYYNKFDSDNIGKLKTIGGLKIQYYDRFDRDELHGKVKSIGDVSFTYYDIFDRNELQGKVKSIGGVPLKYYDRFDLSELSGKLKSVGQINISYYDRFNSQSKTGHVKAVKGISPQVMVMLSDKISDDVEISEQP
jgi:hypothetical protein